MGKPGTSEPSAQHSSTVRARPSAKEDSGDLLLRLEAGNRRFREARQLPGPTEMAAEDALAEFPKPFAMVLGCADARVPVEQVFDCGAGELFVVRSAAGVPDTLQVASIEMGWLTFGLRQLIVLGHTDCAAVQAACRTDVAASPSLSCLRERIRPAIERAVAATPAGTPSSQWITQAIRENVRLSIETLLGRSPVLRAAVGSGELRIEGAFYDLRSGLVEWLGPEETSA